MKAFPDGSAGGPTLVIKSLNGEYHRGASAHLRWACGDRSDIIIVDGAWSVADTHALAETADAVISLHRAEGYGLWLLEALALGKPVIATDHPGNRAFMTPENSWLVSAKAVPTPDDVEPYNVGATWLEPDVDAAAELLRTVYDGRHSHLVLDRRARAQADVAPLVDGRAAAMFVRSRLIRS